MRDFKNSNREHEKNEKEAKHAFDKAGMALSEEEQSMVTGGIEIDYDELERETSLDYLDKFNQMDFNGMSVQEAAAMVMLDAGASRKRRTEEAIRKLMEKQKK